MSDDEEGDTLTDATGGGGAVLTVTVAVPLCPSLVAVISAVPIATAVTNPLADTVAFPLLLVDQVTTRPDNTLPAESRTVAVSDEVCPGSRVSEFGDKVTDATLGRGAAETVAVALALSPAADAVMVAEPRYAIETMPVDDTLATCGSDELQVTV